MTSIAETLACDASNVTGIVDRLESRGLIVRGAAVHDRRIKTITLTPRGKDVVGELTAGFLEPPNELRRLSEPHLRRLHELLQQAFVQRPGHGGHESRHTSKAAAKAPAIAPLPRAR
jgi:DNA-binding MarR family transcriptional regulator